MSCKECSQVCFHYCSNNPARVKGFRVSKFKVGDIVALSSGLECLVREMHYDKGARYTLQTPDTLLYNIEERHLEWVSSPVKTWHKQQLTLLADGIVGTVDVVHHPKCKVVQLTQTMNPNLPHVLATIPEDYQIDKNKEIVLHRGVNEYNT